MLQWNSKFTALLVLVALLAYRSCLSASATAGCNFTW